ncbi:MAG: hypothetical protein ABIQ07_03230, partial [Ginsengibacter sp.]
LREKKWNLLVKIVAADMIIATLLNLPFTGVGQASVAEVQGVLNKSSKGIPIPALQAVSKNDTISLYEKGLVGDWSLYNKQPGVTREVPYPIRLNNTIKYFDTIQNNPSLDLSNNNFLFVTGANDSKPSVTSFTGNEIAFTLISADTGSVVYQQSFYPHWFYDNGKEKKEVQQYGTNFIAAPLMKGENKIVLTFEPSKVKTGMLISLATFCVIVVLLLFNPAFIRRSLSPS